LVIGQPATKSLRSFAKAVGGHDRVWITSQIGFGAWAIGADWGNVDDATAMGALHAAVDAGVTFIDTADAYGDGRSERFVGQLVKERSDGDVVVATKAGRRLDPHTANGHTGANIEAFIDRRLVNLDMDSLDLLQLHCPPTDVYYQPEMFEALEGIKAKGKIRHHGVSVERVEEAMRAIEYPGVETIQSIFNMFRQRPRRCCRDRGTETCGGHDGTVRPQVDPHA
jgi:aryl-alcohol dehydrogenase-like predicted oxidoreductase